MNEHEPLRKALAWLLQQPRLTPRLIAEASRHFDLSPLDEEFLHRYFFDRPSRGAPQSERDQNGDLESS
ncbi:hypothetical protein [Zobellella sp. An-6]|uniref:hypothetical protein n=1 Tax=Zobellella sp. An-6 TaxID=3400218 RepID=UPI00404162A9